MTRFNLVVGNVYKMINYYKQIVHTVRRVSHKSRIKLLHVSAPKHHTQWFRSFLRLNSLGSTIDYKLHAQLIISLMYGMYPPNIKSTKWLLRTLSKSLINAVRCGFVVLTYKDFSGRTGIWIRCSSWKTVKKKTWFCVRGKSKILYFKYIRKKFSFHLFNREGILAY